MCKKIKMDYTQAFQFHESTKSYGSILGLDSIRELMHELDDVWEKLEIVHVAGTNGKGSVCCFLASVLKEAGYQVGQYTSPAVFGMRDMYRLNGECILEEEYAFIMQEVADACGRMAEQGLRHPTVFEVETALAFLWFYRKKCDIVLLETGMGGSMDATNLIQKPLCSVITSVSMDHMAFLGNSLTEIAEAKAGIIKEGCPVVSAVQCPQVRQVIEQKAGERHAPYYTAKQIKQVLAEHGKLCCLHPELGILKLSMTGSYQTRNVSLAIETLAVLQGLGYPMQKKQICSGLEKAVWPGRFECICKHPLFYIDGAHNPVAAMQLKESLDLHFPHLRRIGIMGVMADKPYDEMLDILLPAFERIYTITPDNPRSLPAAVLAEEIQKRGGISFAEESIALACQKALKEGNDTVILAFGSLFFLNEVKQEVTGKKKGGDLL